jgi:hypothetical protein
MKATRNLRYDIRELGRDSNLASSECECRALTLAQPAQWHSVLLNALFSYNALNGRTFSEWMVIWKQYRGGGGWCPWLMSKWHLVITVEGLLKAHENTSVSTVRDPAKVKSVVCWIQVRNTTDWVEVFGVYLRAWAQTEYSTHLLAMSCRHTVQPSTRLRRIDNPMYHYQQIVSLSLRQPSLL